MITKSLIAVCLVVVAAASVAPDSHVQTSQIALPTTTGRAAAPSADTVTDGVAIDADGDSRVLRPARRVARRTGRRTVTLPS